MTLLQLVFAPEPPNPKWSELCWLCDPIGEADMKELVEMIAKALVDNPEQVVVTEVEGEQTTVLELRVAPTDLGKVIGKQGRTARCIRTLLGAAGMKLRKRFVLEILE